MHKIFMRKVAEIAALLLASGVLPPRLAAQLVPDAPPSSSQPKSSAQTSSSTQTPSGKRRLSQEIQLTGDQLWSDTGIDLQAGERIVVTATGNLRYSDAPDDNDPEGRTFRSRFRFCLFGTGTCRASSRPV